MNKEEFIKKLDEVIKDSIKENGYKSSSLMKAIHNEYMKIGENYDSYNEELKEMFNSHIKAMTDSVEIGAVNMQDSILKRQTLRMIKRTKGEHFNINQLVNKLESNNDYINDKIKKETNIIFEETIQMMLDFLSDIGDNGETTTNTFHIISLYYLIIDELVIANHLLKHNYMNQALSHIRIVYEALDKIMLFRQIPEYIDLWINNPDNKNYERFSPANVREKIGKPRYDKQYSLLCNLGTHTAYENVKSRFQIQHDASGNGQEFVMWLGGAPFSHNIALGNGLLVFCSLTVIIDLIKNFESYLLSEEVDNFCANIMIKLKSFFSGQITETLKKSGIDTKELIDIIVKS